jgi:murein L,D-transpeptidase YcbB/YkuD
MGDLDVAVTTSIARAIRALHSGRLDPARVDSNLILLHHPLALGLTLDSLAASDDPRRWIDRVQPQFRQYRQLVQALARYREYAGDADNALSARPPRLNTGRKSGRIATLRRTLEWTGDLRWGSTRGVASDSIADTRMIAAIGRFQRRHRLPGTGRLDSLTWVYLRGGLAGRIQQMGRTLEQYRWLPHELKAPLLFVNIPAFRLEAMDRLDAPDSEMFHVDVVVGTAYKTQTPVLTAALTSVDFMPDWDVPPSIAKAELRVEALQDSTYLERNHMDLIRNMRILPPTRPNIELIGKGVRVRQRPGPDNPLGRIKFVMPNQFDIYLHDTPARSLFAARQRDFSHGCIRLSNALALAKYVLRERPDWTDARIDSALNDSSTIKVRLPVPMLVAIVYATVDAREDGRVVFYPDVYGHDRALQLLLAGAPRDTLVAERSRAMAVRHPTPVASSPQDSLPRPPSVPPAVVPHPPGVPAPLVTPVRRP